MRVVLDDVGPERAPGEVARLEALGRLGQRVRHALQVAGRIHVAREAFRRLEFSLDSVQPGCERGGEREIRIAVGTRNAALDAERLSFADDTEAGGAVVVAPGQARRCPRSIDVALV